MKTTDYFKVDSDDTVWEILYEWLSPELSLAYPYKTKAYCVPEGYSFWARKIFCEQACKEINENAIIFDV